jgi:hypothetical protein
MKNGHVKVQYFDTGHQFNVRYQPDFNQAIFFVI